MTATRSTSYRPEAEPRADGPPGRPKGTAQAVLRRSGAGIRNKNLTTLAAALTYYGVLAAVPGLIVLFTVLGMLGGQITNGVAHEVNSVAPGSSGHFVQTLLSQARSHATGTGIMAVIGALIALWSASSYVSSFRQAANIIYEVPEGRPAWKTIPLRLAVTAAAVVLLVVGAVIVVVSGSIANAVGNALGVGHTAVVIWEIAKWPVLFVLARRIGRRAFLGQPKRQTRTSQMGYPWGPCRVGGLAGRISSLRPLRDRLFFLQQRLWAVGGPRDIPCLAVAQQHRALVGPGGKCRARP